MRIYTKAGDLAFNTFTFPDGQPHFKLETYERDFTSVTIEIAIKSPTELFQVLLVSDVLRQSGFTEVNLDIRYLMGARMDRAISIHEPFTLQRVASLINSCGFSKVRILDVHSDVAIRLIRNSENVLPKAIVKQVIATIGGPEDYIVCPDKGAEPRIEKLCPYGWAVRCSKVRDVASGNLLQFKITDRIYPISEMENLLIVDDICDGGGTFVGLAKELRKAGASRVYLYITHGIFSKGLEALVGIDKVFTTDSYCNYATGREFKGTVVIPVSMKELV